MMAIAPVYTPPADQNMYVVWIVDNPDYLQPTTIISSSSTDLIYEPRKKVKIERPQQNYYWNLSRDSVRVEQPLKAKAKPQYARKHCSQHDRKVNKRKAFIKSCQTRKFVRYLNYLRKR